LSFVLFQAEDGIRDRNVTGVQTCALPILYGAFHSQRSYDPLGAGNPNGPGSVAWQEGMVEYGAEMLWDLGYQGAALAARVSGVKIGRASCRERVLMWVVVRCAEDDRIGQE